MTKRAKSKRLTCRKRYKILRKIREHHKKVRKNKKEEWHNKKEPGIPNSHPLKLQLLKQLQKENEMDLRASKLALSSVEQPPESDERMDQFASGSAADPSSSGPKAGKALKSKAEISENSLKTHSKEYQKVVEASDVVIQVLDARDPLGSRSKLLEDDVISRGPGKTLVLLLNKIDLVPKSVIVPWLKFLRREHPTIAFKASTQSKGGSYAHKKANERDITDADLQTTACIGANSLMNCLGKIYRSKGAGTAITVGIVGYPNVGKSSVINSIKRSKVCIVGAEPGVTKVMQEVKVSHHVRVLDCPGVVLLDTRSSPSLVTIVGSCIKNQQSSDPLFLVEKIFGQCNKQQLMTVFEIGDFDSLESLMALMARRFGKLKKGGVPDKNAIAKIILNQWNSGKIGYYTEPPVQEEGDANTKIASAWRAEFDLDGITQDEIDEFGELTSSFGKFLKLDPLKHNPLFPESDAQDVDLLCSIPSSRPPQQPKLALFKMTGDISKRETGSSKIVPKGTVSKRKLDNMQRKKNQKLKNRASRLTNSVVTVGDVEMTNSL